VVKLIAVFGEYLPVGAASVDAALSACNLLTATSAEETVRMTSLSAFVFSPQGVAQGTLKYRAQPNDHFVLDASAFWRWEDPMSDGHEVFSGTRGLRLTIDPANYTPDLINSSARCPTVGSPSPSLALQFYVIFDVRSGAIVSTHTAQEFGCVP